jgi:hypothetical protein
MLSREREALRERRASRKRRALGLVGVLFTLVGVTGVGFVLVFTNDTSAYLAVLAELACFVVAGGLSLLAWRRESITVAGRQFRWQQVGDFAQVPLCVSLGVLYLPSAPSPLLGAVVLAGSFGLGVLSYAARAIVRRSRDRVRRVMGRRLEMETWARLTVAGLFVLVLLVGGVLVAIVSA